MRMERKARAAVLGTVAVCSTTIAGAAVAQSAGIEEMTITAQRREESAQKASISIDVLQSDALEDAGVYSAVDLTRIAPSVQIAMGGTSLQIYIRGSGDFSTTSYNHAAVVQNFDGVPASRSQWINGQFFDLQRVELLKGPQGTLYGRNAVGGALNLIPNLPEFDDFSGYISLGIQNYSGYSAEGAVNVPISATSAARASFQVVDRDGYIDDGTNDDEHVSLRLQYLNEVNDDLTVRLTGNYQDYGGRGPGKVAYVPAGAPIVGVVVPDDPWTSIEDSLNVITAALPSPVPGPLPIDTDAVQQDVESWGINAHIDWQTPVGTLTLIPAYQYVKNASTSLPTLYFSTFNGTTGEPSHSDAYTFEARLADQTERLKWVVGAFYYNEDALSRNYVRFGNVYFRNFVGNLDTETYAFFGESTFSFTDRMRAILGLRYTDDKRTVDAKQYNQVGFSIACPAPGGTGPGGDCEILHVEGEYNANRLNYRAGLEFDLADDSMLFATVATGFKSGGQGNTDLPPYRPEDLTAYTIGIKNQFMDNTLQLNGELFWIDYDDHQEALSTLDRSGSRVSTLTNAGKATSKGVSVDLTWVPTEYDYLRVAVEYNKARYDSFVYYDYRPAPPTVGCPMVSPPPAGAPTGATFEIDCSGFQMARAPEWTGSVTYAHTFDLGENGTLELSPSMTFGSSVWTRATFSANERVPNWELYNASLTYKPVSEKYSVQLFVRNIGDEPVYTGSEQYPFLGAYTGHDINAPRTFGARFHYNF